MKNLKFAQYLSLALLATLIFGWTQLPSTQEKQVAMIEKALPKTVMVYAGFMYQEREVLLRGSGVFITKNGHILTCAHVLDLSTHTLGVTIETFNGDYYPAEIVHISDRYDLAIVKISTDAPINPVRIAKAQSLAVGQEVISIGNPLGLAFTVTHGIISGLNVDLPSGYNMVQSDVFMNPGNSGGPMFNLRGELVGINSRIVPPISLPIFTGLGFSVSPDQINQYLTLFKGLGD